MSATSRELVWPLGGLSLLSPVTLTAAPELAANLLSSTRTQTSIHFHYVAGAIPGLIVGAVFGAAWLVRRRPRLLPWVTGGIVVLGVLANVRLAPVPAWRHVPGGQSLGAREAQVSEHDRIAKRALERIPAGAVVSASNTLGAHLSERRRVLSFPRLLDARWVAVDETRPSFLDRVSAPEDAAAAVRRLRNDPRWRAVFAQDGVLVFRKVG